MRKTHVRALSLNFTMLTKNVKGLEHATIRDNVIFGSKYGYDEGRYNSIVEACALLPDFAIFEAGDLTGKLLINMWFSRFYIVR